jgi:CBS domain-containing protein
MNKVQQLLQVKGNHVWTITKRATVFDGLKLMAEKRIGSLVVMDEDQVSGIFTERDFARKVGPELKKPEETYIEEVMTQELITVKLDTKSKRMPRVMTDKSHSHLPVIEDGKLLGIVSVGDVVKDVIEELNSTLINSPAT